MAGDRVQGSSKAAASRVGTLATAYGTPEQVSYWSSVASGGWTFAEARVVEQYLARVGRVLVVGSGAGRELNALATMGREAVGIELVRPLLEAYRAAPGSTHDGVLAQMEALPFRDASFATVILFNQVLGHGASAEARLNALRESLRVVAPTGSVLTSFYTGSVEDFSVLLAVWSRLKRGHDPTRRPMEGGPLSALTHAGFERRVRGWARGKWTRLRGRVGSRTRGGPMKTGLDLAVYPTGEARSSGGWRVPFHVYSIDEFFADVRSAGGRVRAWKGNAELNAGAESPAFVRSIDHLHFCVLARDHA